MKWLSTLLVLAAACVTSTASAQSVQPASPSADASVPSAAVQAPQETTAQAGAGETAEPPATAQASLRLAREERQALLLSLERIEDRIRDIKVERAQHPIVGPAVMVGVGYGAALAAGAGGLALWQWSKDVKRGWRVGDPDYAKYTNADVNNAVKAAKGLGVASLLPLAVGVVGTVLLIRRLAARRKLDPELDLLQERQRRLDGELRYGLNVGANVGVVSVAASF